MISADIKTDVKQEIKKLVAVLWLCTGVLSQNMKTYVKHYVTPLFCPLWKIEKNLFIAYSIVFSSITSLSSSCKAISDIKLTRFV